MKLKDGWIRSEASTWEREMMREADNVSSLTSFCFPSYFFRSSQVRSGSISQRQVARNVPLYNLFHLISPARPSPSTWPVSHRPPWALVDMTGNHERRDFMSQRQRTEQGTTATEQTHRTSAFNERFASLLAQGFGLSDVLNVLQKMKESQTPYNETTYVHLVALCGRSADSASASKFIREMRQEGYFVPISVYGKFFAICARSNDVVRAQVAWNQMVDDGVKPNAKACGAYMDCLSRAGMVEDAQLVIEKYPVGNTLVSRTSMVSGLARAGRVDDAMSLLREMREKGFPSDVMAYTAVTHALGRQKRACEAINLLHEALAHNVTVDGMLYESVICACGAAGDVDGAFQIVQGMKNSHLELSDRGYEGLLYACGSTCNVVRANIVFRAAEVEKKVTGRVLSAMASALLRSGSADDHAELILNRMIVFLKETSDGKMKRNGVNPVRFKKKLSNLRRIIAQQRRKITEEDNQHVY